MVHTSYIPHTTTLRCEMYGYTLQDKSVNNLLFCFVDSIRCKLSSGANNN